MMRALRATGALFPFGASPYGTVGRLTNPIDRSILVRMETLNIYEAKTKFSKLMRRVEQGEEVLIARDGVVIARIVPETPRAGIKLGRDEGRAWIAEDFEAPLEDFAQYLPEAPRAEAPRPRARRKTKAKRST